MKNHPPVGLLAFHGKLTLRQSATVSNGLLGILLFHKWCQPGFCYRESRRLLGDRAVPGWGSQHWRPPALYEKDEPEQTLLQLRMLDLLPESVLASLRARFGDAFEQLNQTQRLILATAEIEQVITHQRLLEISSDHPHDLSMALQGLVRQDFLVTNERPGRGTVYHLPGTSLPTPDQVFPSMGSSFEQSAMSSEHLGRSSEHLAGSSEQLPAIAGERDSDGCWRSALLDAPVGDNLSALTPGLRAALEHATTSARANKKLPREDMRQLIFLACKDHYLTLNVLAQLLNRNPDALRQQHLNKMVRSHHIRLAFPATPTHEKQAYRASGKDN